MKEHIISKSRVKDFLKELGKSNKIFIPGENNGVSRFYVFDPKSEIQWDIRNTLIPPKEILFPQDESLFEYKNQQVTTSDLEVADTIIFGIRPCDTHGFTMLDKVFGEGDFQDPYYLKKREATTVITLACNRPGINCFCTCINGGPDNEHGSDIILFDLGAKILVRSVTGKGEELLKKGKSLSAVEEADRKKRDSLMKSAREKVKAQIKIENLKEKLDQSFDVEFWDTFHKKCLGCGICTFLCPTCHCFDITEEGDKEKGKRIRCWDSCQFPLFTLHASGHNPRPDYKERMRQRVMHKFNYCPDNFNETFCVGCGRCIIHCPVNLDIREVIETIVGG